MIDHSSAVPMWCSDAQTGLLTDANEAALRFWGYDREHFVGMPALRLLVEDELPRQAELAGRNRWGETGPWKCRRADGSEFFMTVRWQQIVYNQRRSDFVFAFAAGDSPTNLTPIEPFKDWNASRHYDRPRS